MFRLICCAAVLLCTTLAARAQSTPPLSATFQVTSTSNTGYTANLTVTNHGALPVVGYVATLTSPNPIVAATNATLSVNVLGLYVLSPPLSGNVLNVNDTVTFGLTFTGTSLLTPSALAVNLANVPITTLPPSANAPTSVPLSATFQVTSISANGYTANLTITDNGALPVLGYAATLNSPNPITAATGGTLTVGLSGLYVITPPLVANVLNAGSSVTFGLTFTGTSQLPPSVLTVNLAAVPITVLPSGFPTPTPTPNPTATPTPTPNPTATPTPTPNPTATPTPNPTATPTPNPTATPNPNPTPTPTPNPIPGAPGTPILSVQSDPANPTVADVTVTASGNGIAVTYTLLEDGNPIASGPAPAPDANGAQTLALPVSVPFGAHVFQALLTNPVGTSASAEIAYASPGASTITIGSMDDPTQAAQITIDPGTPVGLTLTDLDGGTGPFTVQTNDGRILTASVSDGNTLVLNGLAPGRASVEITDTATGETRFLGVRVKNPDGTLPGLPAYLAVGSGSTSVTSDLPLYEKFGLGAANHRADARSLTLGAGWFNSTQPGGFAVTTYVRDSLKLGMIPFFIYENVDGTANVQNAAYMQRYFTDLRAALDLVAVQTNNDTVGFVLEPGFLDALSQNAVDPAKYVVSVNVAYTSGVLVRGTDPDFPDTLAGYVQAVNYLIHKTLPSAVFGWELNAPVAKNVAHLTDILGLTNGRPAIATEARAVANFGVAAGVTSFHASFVATAKLAVDAGSEGFNADPASSASFWNEIYWNNFLTFTSALGHQTGLPVIVSQLPYGHINHSVLENPAGGLFPDLPDVAQGFEDSATDFFFGDTFNPGLGNRLAYFGLSDVRLAVTVAGDVLTWPSGAADGAAHQVRMILFGDTNAQSTDGTSNPPTDRGWWITALQHYYANGPAPEAATANPVDAVPMPVPAVVGSVIKPKVFVNSGQKGKILLSLSVPAPSRMVIHYKLMGQAINGVEYTLKKSKIVILPGQTQFVVKIKPRAGTTLGGTDGKKVKLLLQPGDGYVVGTPTPLKVKIRVE